MKFLFLLGALLSACSDGAAKAPSAEDWERLEGTGGSRIGSGYGFDNAGKLLIHVGGKLRRYSDADGFRVVEGPGGGILRRGVGRVWIGVGGGYFELPDGADAMVPIPKFDRMLSNEVAIAPSGDVYAQAAESVGGVDYWNQATQTWSNILAAPEDEIGPYPARLFVDENNNLYWVGASGIHRAGPGGTGRTKIYDCRTKLAQQCFLIPFPVADDKNGNIYFWQIKNQEGINRVYKMAPGSNDLTLVGETTSPLVYQSQLFVATDGTVYLGGRTKSIAADYGEVFVFRPGAAGTSFGRPPGQIAQSPDGTVYAIDELEARVYRLKR